jgi:hypothetical protein
MSFVADRGGDSRMQRRRRASIACLCQPNRAFAIAPDTSALQRSWQASRHADRHGSAEPLTAGRDDRHPVGDADRPDRRRALDALLRARDAILRIGTAPPARLGPDEVIAALALACSAPRCPVDRRRDGISTLRHWRCLLVGWKLANRCPRTTPEEATTCARGRAADASVLIELAVPNRNAWPLGKGAGIKSPAPALGHVDADRDLGRSPASAGTRQTLSRGDCGGRSKRLCFFSSVGSTRDAVSARFS